MRKLVKGGGLQIGRRSCSGGGSEDIAKHAEKGLEEVLKLKETMKASHIFTETPVDENHSSLRQWREPSPFDPDLTDSLSGFLEFFDTTNDVISAMQVDSEATKGNIVIAAKPRTSSDSSEDQQGFCEENFPFLPDTHDFGSPSQAIHHYSLIQREEDGSQHAFLLVQNMKNPSSLPAETSLVECFQSEACLSDEMGTSTADLMDTVSDAVEAMDDLHPNVLPAPSSKKKKVISKNITSERKRRQRLNDRLYALRALVPNISKMNKTSIVADAIQYVSDLQKQVEEIESDISNLKGEAVFANRSQGADAAPSTSKNSSTSSDIMSDNDSSNAHVNHTTIITKESCGRKSVQLQVSKMGEQVYHLHFSFPKLEGGLLDVLQGLYSLNLDILNASLICHQNEFHNNIITKMKGWEDLSISEVEKLIKNMMFKCCTRSDRIRK